MPHALIRQPSKGTPMTARLLKLVAPFAAGLGAMVALAMPASADCYVDNWGQQVCGSAHDTAPPVDPAPYYDAAPYYGAPYYGAPAYAPAPYYVGPSFGVALGLGYYGYYGRPYGYYGRPYYGHYGRSHYGYGRPYYGHHGRAYAGHYGRGAYAGHYGRAGPRPRGADRYSFGRP
jgi:hypothetical protein